MELNSLKIITYPKYKYIKQIQVNHIPKIINNEIKSRSK